MSSTNTAFDRGLLPNPWRPTMTVVAMSAVQCCRDTVAGPLFRERVRGILATSVVQGLARKVVQRASGLI